MMVHLVAGTRLEPLVTMRETLSIDVDTAKIELLKP